MHTPRKQGILLAIEGIDGAGKTTQVEILSRMLADAGEEIVVSKEPTDGKWGRKLRESAANGRLPLETELDLFIRDRKEHINSLILPSINEGKIVILDRYFYSTIAYQGGRGADNQAIEKMMEFAPVPDMTFVLAAPPALTLHRISNDRNETPNAFEQLDALALCSEIFDRLVVERSEVHRINATQSIDSVQQDILRLLLANALKHKRCAKSYDCDVLFCSLRQAGECQWATLHEKLAPGLIKH